MQSVRLRVACFDKENLVCDPRQSGLEVSDLEDILRQSCSPPKHHNTDLFGNTDDGEGLGDTTASFQAELVEDEGGVPVFFLNSDSLSFRALQEIRNFVLSGDFDLEVARRLGHKAAVVFVADRSEFAELYETTALALDDLTDHQRDKLAECSGEDGHPVGDVHLMAPAGAGKTFVALHRVLRTLRSSSEPFVLFVARNDSLAYFAAAWIARRVPAGPERFAVLRRFHVLHEPFAQGPWQPRLRRRRVELEAVVRSADKASAPGHGLGHVYALLVVDEAHHVYADAACRAHIEAFVQPGVTHRMLLSCVAASASWRVPWPSSLAERKSCSLSAITRRLGHP